MNTRSQRIISAFLIHLVLTIPLYTTSVYATINKVSTRGSNNIDGFIMAKDFITFLANVVISGGSEITKEQVKLGDIIFDSCAASPSGGFDCTLRYPSTDTGNFYGSSRLSVSMFNDKGTLDSTKTVEVIIDNKAPSVSLSLAKDRFSSQDKIIIDYEVTDTACDNNNKFDELCKNKCVGIKKIELYTLDESKFKQSIDLTTDNCNVKQSYPIETIDSNVFKDGKNTIFAKAYDKFDQASEQATVTFDVDTTKPDIQTGTFTIERKDISLSTFSPNIVPVEVSINISANDLDLNSVTADLSALNPSTASLRDAKAACTSLTEDIKRCVWTIELKPNEAGTKTVTINAKDTSGNIASMPVNKALTLDNQGPVVSTLLTPIQKDGKALAKSGANIVTAVFDETTGLSNDEVFLHVGSSVLSAKNCTKESNWVCAWGNIDFGSIGASSMSIESDTKDILGNSVGQNKVTEVIIDSTPPRLLKEEDLEIKSDSADTRDVLKIGDKFDVTAKLTEENDVTATADFSKFISASGASSIAGVCTKGDGNVHTCSWPLDKMSAINRATEDVIIFTFTDTAGNSFIKTRRVIVLGVDGRAAPDFWDSSTTCSPKTIDREMAPFIKQRMFCEVKLTPKQVGVSTAFISEAICAPDKPIIDSYATFNRAEGSTSPVIKLTLKTDANKFNIDDAKVSCTLDIYSKTTEGKITAKKETENIEIPILFYNFPQLPQEAQKKIDDAKENAKKIGKVITKLDNLIDVAKKICRIMEVMYTVVVLYYTITTISKNVEQTCRGTFVANAVGACEPAYASGVAACQGTETTSNKVDKQYQRFHKYCDYVTCERSLPWLKWGDDAENWINNAPIFIGPGRYAGSKANVDLLKNVQTGRYMDPQNNLLVATLFACVPGIANGLDNLRQIYCVYADCMQNGVGQEGYSISVCEAQKHEQICEYVTGELFALFPWTAFFDHYMGLVREALSNPFTALGVAVSLSCSDEGQCAIPGDGGSVYAECRFERLRKIFTSLAEAGSVAENIISLKNEKSKTKNDYCEKIGV